VCGIIGYLSPNPCTLESFIADRDRLAHRGPDDAGAWHSMDSTVRLGHRRLSILDLSPAAHQPMVSECRRYVIAFNGEVYNYLELRKTLEVIGHRFRGKGDTEVIMAAYREWGEGCLNRFNGMFAIAIWDHGTADTPPSLFLARDRVGKKPLYYAHRGQTLAFSSELKGIPHALRDGIDLQALNYYLALGYVPGSLCIASGVNKLQPAHAARFRPDSGELKIWRWWQLPSHNPAVSADLETLIDESETLLRDAVRLRMRSDVPVGVLLSGGLDSSLVVACAAHLVSHPIKTFTMGLPGSKLDETDYANIVARHFATDHHVVESSQPSLNVLVELAPFIDEPIADSSLIPAYMVSKLTAQHVKVALGGDGGDELFGGYDDYTTAFADNARIGRLPPWAFHSVSALAGLLPPGVRGRNRLYALRGGPFQSLVWGTPFFDEASRRKILTNEVVESLGDDFCAPELFRLALFETGSDPVDGMTRTHFGSILPDDFLVKVDRASMSASLEMRCPLLDVRLIEFAFGRLPSRWKVHGHEGRRLQKLLGKRLLPPSLDINRKQGFSIPMNEWLRGTDKSWRDILRDGLPDSISAKSVQDLIRGHLNGRTNGARLFSLMMLSASLRNLFPEQIQQ
jgi:asparagine synthase (glutamine-hydrolysing)